MSFMKTYLGNKFYPSEPEKTKFELEDIAHALSNLCRFGGHCAEFYPVSRHSVLVSKIVASFPNATPDLELWGLMHDSTEAYMIDIPTPLKATMPDYSVREDALMKLIAARFELPAHGEEGLLPAAVKTADRIALVTEARQLFPDGISDWSANYQKIESFPYVLKPMSQKDAKLEFLARWEDIQRRRKR